MKDPTKLKELILEKVDLGKVMLDYGVQFVYSPSHTEESQYRCPFHGKDNKPSARFYGSTKTCYCFYCKKTWDVISFVREKEQFRYYRAMQYLVEKYGVDVSSLPDNPEFTEEKKQYSELNVQFITVKTLIMEKKYKLPLDKYRALCWVFLSLTVKDPSDPVVKKGLDVLETKILEMVT